MTHTGSNQYVYDGFNRRVKTVDGNGTRYSFYSQSGKLVFERVSGHNRENYYLGAQLVAYQQQGMMRYIHADLLGSVAANSDSNGAFYRVRYQPFGKEWGSVHNEMGYTGHKHDTDIGVTYMQARYYDPVIGRFYSNDPIGFRDVHSFNRYAYANNNPYKYIDPDGRETRLMVEAHHLDMAVVNGSMSEEQRVQTSLAQLDGAVEGMLTIAPGGALIKATRYMKVGLANKLNKVPKSGQGGLNLFKWKAPTSLRGTGWKEGDHFLHLPNKGSAKANWKQNSSRLREEMRKGNPIYDSHIDPKTGQQIKTDGFLNAERNLLENQGWRYDSTTRAYHPPGS